MAPALRMTHANLRKLQSRSTKTIAATPALLAERDARGKPEHGNPARTLLAVASTVDCIHQNQGPVQFRWVQYRDLI